MASAFWHLLTLDLCQYHTVCEYWFKTIVEALMSWALKYICDLRNSSLIAKAQQTPGVHQISVSWLLWWKQWPLTLACVLFSPQSSVMMNCQAPRKPYRVSQMTTIFITLLCFPSFLGASVCVTYTMWRYTHTHIHTDKKHCQEANFMSCVNPS